jgi:hypothetical protein
MADGGSAPCWCTELPPVVPVPGVDARCWCPQCLKQHMSAQRASQNGISAEVPPAQLK